MGFGYGIKFFRKRQGVIHINSTSTRCKRKNGPNMVVSCMIIIFTFLFC